MNKNYKGPIIRFWRFVNKTDTCWLWTSKDLNSQGYGRFDLVTPPNRVRVMAHRFSWELAYGPIPEGQFVCHRCDVPLCVNPEHLFLGTHLDNMADARQKNRFRCGEDRPQSKLTTEQVLLIRAMKGLATHQAIADRFGIGREGVSKIIRGERWQHLL